MQSCVVGTPRGSGRELSRKSPFALAGPWLPCRDGGRGGRTGVSEFHGDLASLPDLVHGHANTGPVRDRRPVYVDLLPPCNAGCPAGENIQAWLSHTKAGRHEQAWRQLVADNPLPAIHGRVCYHPCESVCNRADLDSAVSIHSVERFLGDLAPFRSIGAHMRSRPNRCSTRASRRPAQTSPESR
jgi:hypothetical protein